MVASDADAKLTILFPIKIANKTSSNRSATFSAFLAPGRPSSAYWRKRIKFTLEKAVSEALKNAYKIIMITSIK